MALRRFTKQILSAFFSIFFHADCATKYACHGDTKQFLFGTGELAEYYEYLNKNDRAEFDERYSIRFPDKFNVITDKERALGKQFRTWVASFVKNQDPGEDWPQFVDSGNYQAGFNYQHATRESEWELINNWDDEGCKFWDDLNNYGKF